MLIIAVAPTCWTLIFVVACADVDFVVGVVVVAVLLMMLLTFELTQICHICIALQGRFERECCR